MTGREEVAFEVQRLIPAKPDSYCKLLKAKNRGEERPEQCYFEACERDRTSKRELFRSHFSQRNKWYEMLKQGICREKSCWFVIGRIWRAVNGHKWKR